MNRNRFFIKAFFGILAVTASLAVKAKESKLPAVSSRPVTGGPLLFTENKGQVATVDGRVMREVLFTAYGNGARVLLTANGIQYQFSRQADHGSKTETHRFGIQLLGANKQPEVVTQGEGLLKENFYLPHCPNGITGVSTFSKLIYKNVYPDIDWVVYSKGTGLEYDFVVRPGGDPTRIRLKVEGTTHTSINASGELVMKTLLGAVKEHAPVSFAGNRKIRSRFVRHSDGSIGFAVALVKGETITIDPFVEWATYYGGSLLEVARNSATDARGNLYVSGWTNSQADIAGAGHQLTYGGGTYDAFLIKFDAAGNRRWATYYGGTGTDYGYACAVSSTGDAVYLAGVTSSSTAGSIATAGAHQLTSGGGNDGYLARFDSTGVRQWGTYYGGSGSDQLYSCTVDGNGNPYIAGYTPSVAGIASPGAFQTAVSGSNDAFVAKFTPSGTRVWGSYFGGSLEDRAFNCTVSGSNLYLTGFTASTAGLTTPGVFQPVYGTGSYDMFAAQFDTSGSRKWCTYLGGSGSDYAYGSAAFDSGLYISGYTSSSSNVLTTTGAHQTTSGGSFESVFVKLDINGNRVWGTFFGGPGAEYGYGCSISPQGDVYFSGYTTSTSAIAFNGAQNTISGSTDVYIAKFSPGGTRIWASYLGGAGNDSTYSCAATDGAVYIPGFTGSATGIATAGAYQATPGGGSSDLFIARVSDPYIVLGTVPGTSLCTGNTVVLPYMATGTFAAGNVFTAQLSDATGDFSVPVSIGTATAASGNITATIPAVTAIGNAYRLRIVATDTSLRTADNGTDIVIRSRPVAPAAIIGSNTICNSALEMYYINAAAGATSYTWTLPIGWTGSSITDTIHTTAGSTGGTITVTANNSCGSSAVTALPVSIATNVLPGALLTASDSVICAATPVTFFVTPLNGGTTPSYQWKKNGVNVGTNSNTYTDASLVNNDTVYVVITSNSLCVSTPTATSNRKLIRVNAAQDPSVTITANPGTTVPGNQTITFTANTVNAGAGPVYQWFVSGSAIAGANGSTLTLTGLADGDSVYVRMVRATGNGFTCSTTDTAISSSLIIHIAQSIGSLPDGSNISIYPNPGKGLVTISGKALRTSFIGKACTLTITNTIGQVLQQFEFTPAAATWNTTLQLYQNLPDGLYYMRIQTPGGQKVMQYLLTR